MRFQRELFEAGYLVPGWPPELGGRNATPQEQMAYFEVVAERQVPRSCNPQGLSICAASVVEFGTDEQKEKFVVPTLKGEVTWCLGMSEPNAGSDLASLTTKAERRDGHFVVNGQKVWTSGAQDADYCLCFVRTDPDAPKHKGISTLIIDMATPGITCRALPELTDPYHADFNEVFFTDVEVPEENLLGELNHGWTVSQGSLRHERGMLWINNANRMERTMRGLVRVAARPDGRGGTLGDDPRLAEAIGRLATDTAAIRCMGYRGFAKSVRGEMPPEHMVLKLFASEAQQRALRGGSRRARRRGARPRRSGAEPLQRMGHLPLRRRARGGHGCVLRRRLGRPVPPFLLQHHCGWHVGDPAQHRGRARPGLASGVSRRRARRARACCLVVHRGVVSCRVGGARMPFAHAVAVRVQRGGFARLMQGHPRCARDRLHNKTTEKHNVNNGKATDFQRHHRR